MRKTPDGLAKGDSRKETLSGRKRTILVNQIARYNRFLRSRLNSTATLWWISAGNIFQAGDTIRVDLLWPGVGRSNGIRKLRRPGVVDAGSATNCPFTDECHL
ncbi:MAG: hypothetical protein Fues2KO_17790 [Fuerstiella sp.]